LHGGGHPRPPRALAAHWAQSSPHRGPTPAAPRPPRSPHRAALLAAHRAALTRTAPALLARTRAALRRTAPRFAPARARASRRTARRSLAAPRPKPAARKPIDRARVATIARSPAAIDSTRAVRSRYTPRDFARARNLICHLEGAL
jgi:hypothetical protein